VLYLPSKKRFGRLTLASVKVGVRMRVRVKVNVRVRVEFFS